MEWGLLGSLLGPVGAVVGMIVPPVVDFVKKKWLPKEADTPEATLSTLATTKPEIMADYIDANAKLLHAQVEFFNRDVVGQPSRWVTDIRASIRPITTILCMAAVLGDVGWSVAHGVPTNPAVAPAWTMVGNWFGTRLT